MIIMDWSQGLISGTKMTWKRREKGIVRKFSENNALGITFLFCFIIQHNAIQINIISTLNKLQKLICTYISTKQISYLVPTRSSEKRNIHVIFTLKLCYHPKIIQFK